MRLRWVIFGIAGLAIVLVAAVVVVQKPERGEFCTVSVGDTYAHVDLEQGQWAALIAAIARRRELPPRATSIAVATAFQESKIHNIDYGDRDSVGLFQQRPSQGWGTTDQIMDPHYAIGRFYDALVEVDDFESMEITQAAQRVQRSAYPGAYAAHEEDARALASALSGFSPAAFTCQIQPGPTGNPRRVAHDIEMAFGALSPAVGDSAVRYHLQGEDADRRIRGWAIAHYAVANAKRLHVSRVAFDGRHWTAAQSPDGWQHESDAPSSSVTIYLN